MKYNKVSVVKKIMLLLMTMALAVALVACSGAAGTPGPAGPPGEQGPPGEPVTTDPTVPQPGDSAVAMIKGIEPFIFDDSATGDMDPDPQTIDLSGHFYPTTGLTYSVEVASAVSKRVDAMVVDENMLKVMLKPDAKNYENDKLKVKATSANGTYATIDFEVRRNQAPMGASVTVGSVSEPPTIVDIWVGSQEEVTASAHSVNKMDASVNQIPVLIGKLDRDLPVTAASYFFQDDDGNKLSFVSDLSVGQAKMLSITDGEMKVILLGKKSTFYDTDDDADKENAPIMVKLLARDDGGLDADDEAEVLRVHIDMAPTTTGNIGTKVITLGTTPMDKVAVPNIISYFNDDRHLTPQLASTGGLSPDARLMYYVWSDDPKVASVSINTGNKNDVENMFVDVDGDDTDVVADFGFYVEGKGRGTAMIMVKAQQPPLAASVTLAYPTDEEAGTSGMKQSVTLSFMVEVK